MRPVIATIRIVAQAKPADLFSAIDRALDAGSIQGAITDDTPIEITSALSEDEFDARRRYCDHTGLRVSRQRKRRTITRDDVVRINEAMTLLRRARDLLEAAGAVQTVAALRELGVKIGSGTGYTPAMMARITLAAEEQGYAPDVVICAGDTPSGRPSPLMVWAALIEMDAWPARACIKVDDAPVGIIEGKEAGCWTVGISASGNEVGLDAEAYRALPEHERRAAVARAEARLRAAGADYVIEDVSELLPVVHEIAGRIAAS